MNKESTDFFENEFLKQFQALGEYVSLRYGPVVNNYALHVIPFETSRMAKNQSLMFENSSLEKDKMDLLAKVYKLKAENDRAYYLMYKQVYKIHELYRYCESLEQEKADYLSIIEALKTTCSELYSSVAMKVYALKQVEIDKQTVIYKYDNRNNDYNILLSNYMKEKNTLAEKLNSMNYIELALMYKEKLLKAEMFYLYKQRYQFEEKVKYATGKRSSQTRKYKIYIFKYYIYKYYPLYNYNLKDTESEILRKPLKKIFKHHQNEIYDCSLNYSGNLLATCGGDRAIKLFDILNLRNGPTINSNSAENVFISAALNYGGERVLAGSTNNSVTMFNAETGRQLHSFVGHGDKVNSVSWSSSKEKCLSGSDDKQLKIWYIEKACNLHSINCGRAVKVVTSNSIEPVVYTGHSDGSVRIYSLMQGTTPVAQIKGIINYQITSISLLSNRYQALVCSSEGSTMHFLDLKMNKSIAKYEHKDFFNTAAQGDITPSYKYALAGNCDGCIYYWYNNKQNFCKKISGHDAPITALKYHSLSGVLVSTDKDGNVIIWQ